jgi:hypothetical protein
LSTPELFDELAKYRRLGSPYVVLGILTNSLFRCLGGKLADVAKSSIAFQATTRFASGVIAILLGSCRGVHADAPTLPVTKAERGKGQVMEGIGVLRRAALFGWRKQE